MSLSSQKMDKFILSNLLNASNNADIARKIGNSEICLDLLTDVQNNNTSFDKETQLTAQRIRERVQGWETLRDALSGDEESAVQCGQFMKDICLDDLSLGVWLSSLLNDRVLLSQILNVEHSSSTRPPPALWTSPSSAVSHSDLARFIRALVGVSTVLAVLSWVDSLGNDDARQHILSIVHLWQGVDGYRQVRYFQFCSA